jgi:hypothetical protein
MYKLTEQGDDLVLREVGLELDGLLGEGIDPRYLSLSELRYVLGFRTLSVDYSARPGVDWRHVFTSYFSLY